MLAWLRAHYRHKKGRLCLWEPLPLPRVASLCDATLSLGPRLASNTVVIYNSVLNVPCFWKHSHRGQIMHDLINLLYWSNNKRKLDMRTNAYKLERELRPCGPAITNARLVDKPFPHADIEGLKHPLVDARMTINHSHPKISEFRIMFQAVITQVPSFY